MQSILSGQASYLPVIVLIIAIAAIILILLFMKVYQVKHSAGKKDRPKNLNFRPPGDITTPLPGIPEIKQGERSEKHQPVDDVPLTDLGDITKNLHALVSKYHLDSITLSTTDGLMIASTRENGQDMAAYYGQVFKQGEAPSVPGMKLFYMTHKGSSVIGIIQSDNLIPDISLERIRNDTEKIMKWWI
ncbi:MAG: hypothetical protein WCJ93_10170 [Methanomicrobiales archaeon]